MKSILPLITLLAASVAFAQTAPAAKKSALQHSVEFSYIASSTTQLGVDDLEGFNVAARAYVWQNAFVALEYYTGMTDTVIPAPADLDVTRLGYGLGAAFEVGPGLLSVTYTFGELEFEADGLGSEEVDQERANLTYSQTFASGITAALGVTQYFNDGIEDVTAVILSVGYDFKNGLSIFATYSPDSADVGADNFSEDTFSLGARYTF